MKNKLKKIAAMTMLFVMLLSVMPVKAFAEGPNLGTAKIDITVERDQNGSRNMAQMINDFRTGSDAWVLNQNNEKVTCEGLQTLQYDSALEQTAMLRAAEVAKVLYETGMLSHTRPNGQSCFTAFTVGGSRGENIAAMMYDDPAAAFQLLQETDQNYDGQGHRRNMLAAEFNAVGIGHAYYEGWHIWVQDFSSELSGAGETVSFNGSQTVSIEVQTKRVPRVEATKESEGNIEYWHYQDKSGDRYFADSQGLNEIRLADTVIPRLHDLVKHEAVEVTCLTDGNIEYWSCTDCGKLFADAEGKNEITENDVIIKAPGHDMKEVTAKDPTCEDAGNIAYIHCDRCGKTFTDKTCATEITDVTVPALGHSVKEVQAKEPGCTSTGILHHWHCDNCGKNFSDAEATTPVANVEIEAVGHKADATKWFSDESGHWHKCTVCGEVTDFCEHNFSEKVLQEPTCTEEGKKQLTCTQCGYECTQSIAKKDHVMEKFDGTAPTCTAEGSCDYWHCNTCNKNYADAEGTKVLDNISLPALGHDLQEVQAKAATCTEQGRRQHFVCQRCGKAYWDAEANNEIPQESYDTTYIPALNHAGTMEKIAAKAPTCTETGNIEYWHCTACGKNFSDEQGQNVIDDISLPPTGHNAGEAWASDGDYHWKACTACGEKLQQDKHNFEKKIITEPTEEHEGKASLHCTVCGYTKDEVIPPLTHTHKFGSQWKYDDNIHWHECACGARDGEAAHVLVAKTVKNPTCTEDGVQELTCDCGYKTTKAIPATGHSLKKVERVEPSCDKAGMMEYWKCESCGKLFTDEEGKNEIAEDKLDALVIPPIAHKNAVKVPAKEATCTEKGILAHWHCPDCGKNFSNEECTDELKNISVPANGHKGSAWNYNSGSHWKTCSVCGDKFSTEQHDFTDKVIKKPTKTENGEMQHICKVCGYTYTEEIDCRSPKTGDSNDIWLWISISTLSLGAAVTVLYTIGHKKRHE